MDWLVRPLAMTFCGGALGGSSGRETLETHGKARRTFKTRDLKGFQSSTFRRKDRSCLGGGSRRGYGSAHITSRTSELTSVWVCPTLKGAWPALTAPSPC